jgi:hypothetical protein
MAITLRQPVRGVGKGDQVLTYQGGDQVFFRGEVPKHRALRHPRATGDICDRSLDATLGEHFLGRGQKRLAVARGVGSQGASGWCHLRMLPS